jgi:rhamnosyl/mannosyltransferase
MNILIISPDAPPYRGGISRLVSILDSGLVRLGHHVALAHPRYWIKEFKFSTIPFHQYNEFDLIHLHGPTPFLSDLILMTNIKSPIVYTHHAEISWLSEGMSKIYRGFHRVLTKKACAIVVHSHDYASLFTSGNVEVIHIPCSFKFSKADYITRKQNPFTVLYVGQFRPFKGIEFLLKAASMLRDVRFVLVGDGYLRPRLMHTSKDLKNVSFIGTVSDEKLRDLYTQSHVICLPSTNTTEAYGLVLIEGALHGCVPIASNLIGVRENINRLKGMLFEPKSHISITQIIRTLSNDIELWTNIAKQSQKAAYEYASLYTPEYYVKKHEERFKKCLQST